MYLSSAPPNPLPCYLSYSVSTEADLYKQHQQFLSTSGFWLASANWKDIGNYRKERELKGRTVAVYLRVVLNLEK